MNRPEVPIQYGFYQILDMEHQDFVLDNISPSIIDHDISIFLEYNLGLTKQERSLALWMLVGWVKRSSDVWSKLKVDCLFGPQLPVDLSGKGNGMRPKELI